MSGGSRQTRWTFCCISSLAKRYWYLLNRSEIWHFSGWGCYVQPIPTSLRPGFSPAFLNRQIDLRNLGKKMGWAMCMVIQLWTTAIWSFPPKKITPKNDTGRGYTGIGSRDWKHTRALQNLFCPSGNCQLTVLEILDYVINTPKNTNLTVIPPKKAAVAYEIPPTKNYSLFVVDNVMFFISPCFCLFPLKECRVSSQNKALLKGHQQPSSPNLETMDYTIQLYWELQQTIQRIPIHQPLQWKVWPFFLLLTCLKAQAFSHFFPLENQWLWGPKFSHMTMSPMAPKAGGFDGQTSTEVMKMSMVPSKWIMTPL